MKNCWVVRLELFSCCYCPPTIIEMVFTNPPTRQDIANIIEQTWRKQSIDVQDASWHYILILDTIPNIPWIGKLESIYGSVECRNGQS